ncbi:hypothetical protein CTI50_25290 [Pseudomonas syringae pv. actinidiae]|nr:hypothetical protein D9N00_15460 [Pseudomonas syringae pv. actinidiae]AYL81125.1 hypothetical protein CN228_15270 [Pseudomonas syringae pv. actinidiae str. Shaanxi_M228]OSO25918.1 hypothetical protein BV361_03242 [Pseudomonas syringae pv. actinidiae]PIH72392.1 hypothetical protein CS299_01575 [Pseudomonas syringae pv. actinidiae]PIH79448.1 hypothetical protein CTI50_25290 [Pseudomonas syringae pv. actinidiae]
MEYICTPFGVLWLARLVGLERRDYELRGRRTEGITFKYTHCVIQRFCDVVYGSSHLFASRRPTCAPSMGAILEVKVLS